MVVKLRGCMIGFLKNILTIFFKKLYLVLLLKNFTQIKIFFLFTFLYFKKNLKNKIYIFYKNLNIVYHT